MTKNVQCKYGFFKLVFAGVLFVALLAGCASGPKYQDMANTIPALAPGQGRIVFYRPSSIGAGIRPVIYLNDEMVGTSKSWGFFFVDRSAGNYTARVTSETENKISFVLEAGETKYLRCSPSLGVFVYRIVISLETPEKAKEELPSLHYTGNDD